ncbi:hypothetical protein SAMN04489761_0696 [Tenacibaculum sp. MAR_2009_124]|uniref:hypothetical protein n=1 Tax=Tenacibaculum sp. MAR_2009_124 TaxID=1250059 RepID=UPI000894D8E0|nr:hypothetical protein [Tenacibaculum sp. MAR_2009_124]SEB43509.1 hypothetical protein SAMN04489761_0696 [Tenacibaculum sp. MAR_2009_124]
MNLEDIKKYSKTISDQLGGLISITIISAEDGMVVDYYSSNDDVDNQLAASFQVEVLRQITRGLNYIDDLENKEIQNLMVSLEDQTHFAFLSDSKDLIVHIIANNKETNVGMVNLFHKKNKQLLD